MSRILQKKPQGSPMKPLKTLLLIMATLGFTACLNENGSSNKSANTTSDTETAPLAINPNTPSLYKSLTLTAAQTTLNKDENTTLKLIATTPDGTTKELDAGIEYIITPPDAVEINGTTLTARKDINVTLQTKAGNTLSNTLTLTITWTVNGYTLPPEPDKSLNDSTLLGIDLNNNGVRDDVERWIYETYDHPIERGIFMQSARAYNKVIVDPSKAHETVRYSDDALACQFYWIRSKENFILDRYKNFTDRKKLKKIQFNTLKRHMAYERYNAEFNGEVFGSPKASKEKCEFDENGTLKHF